MKIGVCIRAKDEQKIICDWVKYYIHLGFDKIFIYDNMSNPSIENTLKENGIYNNDIIEITIDTVAHSYQTNLYRDCINKNKDLDWILLCDADEFIYIKDGTIKDFLNRYTHDTSTILINWVVFGTGGNSTYDMHKTVFEQFTKREDYNHFWNMFVKSFVRPNLINECSIVHVHATINKNYMMKNVYNDVLNYNDGNDKCDYIDTRLNDTTPVVIVHYMTLDFESGLPKTEIAKKYGVTRAYVYQLVNL